MFSGLNIWDLYPDLVKAVRDLHAEVGMLDNGPHSFSGHVLPVTQRAIWLAEREYGLPYVIWETAISALLHNNDRILEAKLNIAGEGNVSRVPEADVESFTVEFLDRHIAVPEPSRTAIIKAVLSHGSKPNSEDDPLHFIAMVDADRLENMGATIFGRYAQHHPNVPILDPVYIHNVPGASWRDIKVLLWELDYTASWADETGPYVLRLPEARALGKKRAAKIRQLIADIKKEREELGLWPNYPKFLL